jgi:hypothetical protein
MASTVTCAADFSVAGFFVGMAALGTATLAVSATPAARADKTFQIGLFIEMPFVAHCGHALDACRSASTIEAAKSHPCQPWRDVNPSL